MQSELYQGIVDSVVRGEARGSEVGKRIVLLASFIGGPRDMRRRYLDAITLVRTFGQLPQDRPDLTSRVFRAKLQDLKDQIIKKRIFGPVAAYVYVVEFQKQGLSHVHMLVILQNDYKINCVDMFDGFVSAEIPNKDSHPRLFGLVIKHMMHGPCGTLNRNNSCMIGGRCKSHYPRQFSEYYVQGLDGYPIYQRRDDSRTINVQNAELSSQWVVHYNPYLLYRYDCHINVETLVDEIKEFQDARWVSAQESMWRIYEFDLNEMSPAGKIWIERKQRKVIGRVNAASPVEGERYYLRLLLLHVRGPSSFNYLLTFNNQIYFTFKEASQSRGLLECDRRNFECLNEATTFQMPYALRRLFATILTYCEPANVQNLWDSFYKHFSEDFTRHETNDDLDVLFETLHSFDFFL
ncbi:uncharacterized protein [Primulina huaijiensis]|uniref:uncharacterized protein n=1 Tax=Primulina huaijiensis TaxID=1492673 RepID=UPI003CC77CB4